MQIRMADVGDQESWDAYVFNHPDGLAYHLFAWKTAVEGAYGYPSIYLIAEHNDRICGVLPVVQFKGLAGSISYVSLPFCDIGGPLADDVDVESALIANLLTIARAEGAAVDLRRQHRDTAIEQQSGKVRMVLPLPESSEVLLGSFKSKLRSQIKKPIKDGLIATIGGTELIEDFYSVFSRNMRDLGSPVHSLDWIEAIVSGYGDNVKVATVRTPTNMLAAAGIILLHKKTISIPWASSLQKFNRSNANMFLYWTFLSFASDRGFAFFDFGRSTPGEGTHRFKAQWGAKAIPLDWIHYAPDSDVPDVATQGHPSNVRLFAAAIWKKLPLFVANTFGPLLRKRISL